MNQDYATIHKKRLQLVWGIECVYYIIALLVIAADQLTKWLVVKNMEYGESIEIIENYLYITSHRNRGAAWGIFKVKCGSFT